MTDLVLPPWQTGTLESIDQPPTISERAAEISREMSRDPTVPPVEAIAAVHAHFITRRDGLLQQVSEIEAYLGFAKSSEDLAVRVAKIEQFLGVKVG